MDTLCLKTAITGLAPSISISGSLDARSNPSQVSAVERPTTEKSSQSSVFSRFSFKYPLKSLWPNSRYNGLAIDDAMLVDNGEGKAVPEDSLIGTMGPEDQNENWVFKILHVKSIWTGEQGKAANGGVVEEECDACRVDDDDEAEVQFDRDSFSRMLRRVSLAEARLYAEMSYLGNLAYSIPKIKGSESLASWQANLLFEPIQFEGLDVLVHRGIYEAAKGIYQQMLPEIHAQLKSEGSCTTFRFTGHSLGGSLALLVNLMLFIRQEVPISSLLPVITFGAPSIMCGGDSLLDKLGLPRSHVQAITMHRDIVPRAFSCNYANHFAELLKAVNGSFRSHPCLNSKKLLYVPMGELLILQPDDKFSPNHHLLPSGSGLYLLSHPLSEPKKTDKQLQAARLVFLNSPHPLEMLSDRSAYGNGGTVQRDHDMNSYLKSLRTVICQELNRIRKSRREHRRRKVLWPLLAPRGGSDAGIVNVGRDRSTFSGILQTGRESWKRFSRIVASQHMHLFLVLLFPARLLLLEAYSMISFR